MRIPTVLWAQRKDKLYLTLDIQDVKDQKIKLENDGDSGKLIFSGKAGVEQQEYALELPFYGAIDADSSKVSISPRHIFCVVMKKETDEYWPRLTKDSQKNHTHVKCDWNKWIDEDEEEEGKDNFDMNSIQNFSGFDGGMGGMGGMGMGGMGMGGMGMGGMGDMDLSKLSAAAGMGMGGADDDDSDDEDLPDLES